MLRLISLFSLVLLILLGSIPSVQAMTCRWTFSPEASAYTHLLPKKSKTWVKNYASFEQIAKKDEFFFQRIQASLNQLSLSFTRSDYKKILHFSDQQNQNFVDFAQQQRKDSLYIVIESSYLKLANDQLYGKDNATSLNFFAKTEFITSFLEVLSKDKNAKKLIPFVLQQWTENESQAFHRQNDFKAASFVFEQIPETYTDSLKDAAYEAIQHLKRNLETFTLYSNTELVGLFYNNKPRFLSFDKLYNLLVASDFNKLNQLLKKVRENSEQNTVFSEQLLEKQTHKEIKNFFELHNRIIHLLSASPRLVEETKNNILYPSARLFELLRKIAANPRKRDTLLDESKLESNNEYYASIAQHFEHRFQIKLNKQETKLIVDYFHILRDLVPRMPFIRTKAMNTDIKGQKFVFSADFKNGGGLELSLVAKQLLIHKNLTPEQLLSIPKIGVDETTEFMNLWARNLEEILRKNISVEMSIQRSGDDFLAILNSVPSLMELRNLQDQLQQNPLLSEFSRITLSTFQEKESIPDGVNQLELLEKEIHRTFYSMTSHTSSKLPLLWIYQKNEHIEVQVLEEIDSLRQHLLREIVKGISRNQNKSIKLILTEKLSFLHLPSYFQKIA